MNTEAPRPLVLSLLAKQRGLTPAKARESPQVAGLRRYDEDGTAEALCNLLIFTAQQLNVVRNLTNLQVVLLSQKLLDRYWHWRMDEFMHVFTEGVAGTWGKVYDRLDPGIVQEWCTQYETQVQGQLIADEAESRAAAFKAAEAGTSAPDDLHLLRRGYLRLRLQNQTDEALHHVLDECRLRPGAPSAALNKELAEEILSGRERIKAAGPTSEETEAGYQRYKASLFTEGVLKQGPPEALDEP